MRVLILAALMIFGLAAGPAPDPAQDKPIPGMVRVRIVTSEGSIVVALDAKRAPKTTANFLAYVDDGRFAGTTFYRASRRKGAPGQGFIQGGIGTDARRMLVPVPLEPTNVTGIRHTDGVISMARGAYPNSANGNFSILSGPAASLDAKPGNPGYAAFGRVVSGMDVVKRILAKPSGGGYGAMAGQMLDRPVQLIRVDRLDGTARPTVKFRSWELPKRR
ncbi:peptidylprolyl isomerase [Sphingomonas sp. G-3-2-10]|uniref:peptidylprolyl isomerase n=1 Tax=Sphingomonas sp. G-3-2-10 TaxID=2728838 RepID=UPI00146F314E|nr:peptidylprolyl isomerase [Sphingomonas sp. G-3-2-10]NML06330.1 peptidylprolyl isomerase [Sphingomonas sp. G-3-2-10]